jgi:hypothetical protein
MRRLLVIALMSLIGILALTFAWPDHGVTILLRAIGTVAFVIATLRLDDLLFGRP